MVPLGTILLQGPDHWVSLIFTRKGLVRITFFPAGSNYCVARTLRSCGIRDTCFDDNDEMSYFYGCISDRDDPCGSSDIRDYPAESKEYTCCCSTNNCNTASFAFHKCAGSLVYGSFLMVCALVTFVLLCLYHF